jgi:RNA polymerase sigma-70 factor (ECF subfamily)
LREHPRNATSAAMDERAMAEPEASTEELLGHANALLRYALVRVSDRATAEDLVQETLVTAVTKLSEFAGISGMRTWLLGILRHKILDHYRWKERHPGDQPDREGVQSGDPEPWFTARGAWRMDPNVGLEALDDDPSHALERSQLRAALQFCIDHLPKALHKVFVLRELEEVEPEATCEAVGISRDSLAVFLYRARQALRACMQKKWVES